MSATYYVSNRPIVVPRDGLTWETAFEKIEEGLNALLGSPGVVEVGPSYVDYTAPAEGYVVRTKQVLRSAGSGTTTINASAVDPAVGAAITAVGKQIQICGFRLEGVHGIDGVRGIGVHVTNATSATSATSDTTENVLVEDMFVEMTEQDQDSMAYAIGYRTVSPPDGEVTRVSEVVLRDCHSKGNGQTTHMQLGSNRTGHVHGVKNIGGHSQDNKYGIFIGGGSLVSTGLNFHNSSEADIFCYQNAIGQIHISSGNSTHSHRFLDHRKFYFQAYNGLLIENYYVSDLQNSDGQAVITVWGPMRLHNVTLFGAKCPQYIAYRLEGLILDRDHTGRVEIDGLTSEHPYPIGGSPYSRPGRIIEAKNVRFVGDTAAQMRANRSPERQVRRVISVTNKPATLDEFILDSRYATEFVVGLEEDAGTPTLTPGVVGQLVGLTFEQNGMGGLSYEWPANCAFDIGSVPPNDTVPPKDTTAFNRQSCRFMWNGSFWEQWGPVSNVRPSAPPPFAPVIDNFNIGNPFWLSVPTGTQDKYRWDWEHVPGGGSLGVRTPDNDVCPLPRPNTPSPDCVCVVNSLGWVGDNGLDLVWDQDNRLKKELGIGLLTSKVGPNAAAVIETGGDGTQPTGISATFKWHKDEGIIAHYKDDQTFWAFVIGIEHGLSRGYAVGWSHGKIAKDSQNFRVPELTEGSSHTLLVQCTARGFVVTVDDTTPTTLRVDDIEKWLPYTKHGIVASDTRVQFTNFSVT